MRVSVLVPTFNRSAYLIEAIESVLGQSYTDCEIIIVDDGSTDDTPNAVRPYLSRIRYIRTENQGPALARNVGMAAATGNYVAYLDSDDLYYPHKIALQAQLLDRRPDVGMVYTEFSAFSDDGYWNEFHLQKYHKSAYLRGHIRYDTMFTEHCSLRDAELPCFAGHTELQKWAARNIYFGNIYETYLYNTVVFTNSMMFRRELLVRTGLQQKRFGHFHDLEFALRLCREAKVAFVDVPTYKLRYHADQISTTRKVDGERVAIKKQRDLLRVTKFHSTSDPGSYDRNKVRMSRQLAKLCRAVAIPLLSHHATSQDTNRRNVRRARQYLAIGRGYGRPEYLLSALTYMPHAVRRVVFKLMSIARVVMRQIQRS